MQLLGTGPEPVPLQGSDDRAEPRQLRFGLGLGVRERGYLLIPLDQFALERDQHRAERVGVVRQGRFGEHGRIESGSARPVNRLSAGPALDARHAPAASRGPPATHPVAQP